MIILIRYIILIENIYVFFILSTYLSLPRD